MPHVPGGANANILSNHNRAFVSWLDGNTIPNNGPHANAEPQFGCTINTDFEDTNTRSKYRKGMQGHWIGEPRRGMIKIFIRGVTESWQGGHWVENAWVPVGNVDKGKPWKSDINDWKIKMDLKKWDLDGKKGKLKATSATSTVLGKTIAGLINEFYTNPAPFMGTKIQDLLDKRSNLGKGDDIESITRTIVTGIDDARLLTTLNKPNFSVTDITRAAKIRINEQLASGMGGGIYMRYHISASSVTRWIPNTKYAYVGKTTDFKDRFDSHRSSITSYGDLTRNSRELISVALVIMSDQDIIDFAYLVEQVFVCLFESYRPDLLVSLTETVEGDKGIEHIEAVQAAHYFQQVAEKVFGETKFPGAVNRSSFGVSLGANYSMPFKEWARSLEQLLFLRHDTAMKDQVTGETIPVTVFRRARPKFANYLQRKAGTAQSYEEMCAFQKYRAGKYFWSVRHSQKVRDGTMGPRQDDPYQLVLEVRTDGKPHPKAWSRLYSIGPFMDWNQARSLAARIEWEYPPKSGQWRHRYLYAHRVYDFQGGDDVGAHANYIKTIAMVRWLFGAEPNNPRPWMPHLKGSAYVLQTVFNHHTQTIEVKPQNALTMTSGAFRSKSSIIAEMQALGLQNVDGPFGQQKMCDCCAMLSTKVLNSLGSSCSQVAGQNYCRNCLLFGRPCCSWTKNGAVRGMRAFSEGMIKGLVRTEGKVTSEDVALNKKYRAGLHCQELPEKGDVEPFRQQLLSAVKFAQMEDDMSDAEDADEDFEEEEGDEE